MVSVVMMCSEGIGHSSEPQSTNCKEDNSWTKTLCNNLLSVTHIKKDTVMILNFEYSYSLVCAKLYILYFRA